MSAYNPQAKTVEEHLANARFQLENVEGYIEMAKDGIEAGFGNAAVKAGCLLESVNALNAAFEADLRRKRLTKREEEAA